MAHPVRTSAVLVSLALSALACGGGGTTGPVVRTPTSIVLVSGSGQTAAAGTNLANPITVRVSDGRGPMAGVTVRFIAEEGGGTPQPAITQTDAEGLATTLWRLGTVSGAPNLLKATATGLATGVTVTGTAETGPAAFVQVLAGSGQLAVVNRAIAVPPTARVTDQFGNPVAGVAVTFSVLVGGGSITGAVVTSGPNGAAQVGGWVLGPAAGVNTLTSTIGTASTAEFHATGTAASLQFTGGGGQSANAGTLIPVPPTVLAVDGDGQPLPGVPVTFSSSQGGGSVVGGVVLTDPAGTARPGGWILGLTPGPNELRAIAPGVSAVVISATGVAGVPATLTAETAGPLAAFLGNFLTARPRVRVRDANGAAVAGVPVVFDVQSGGGFAYGATTLTDPEGYAQAQAWQLGPTAPIQVLRATIPALAPVTFQATATPPPAPGDYRIELRYVGMQPTPAQQAAFDAAVTTWQSVIVGDQPDEAAEPLPAVGTICDALNEPIDDLLIFVRLQTIDGAGGVLGSAGPCWIRDGGGLTVVGGMRFDVADLARLEADGQLTAVVLHEMGHVLGLGTLWNTRGLLTGGGGPDPIFTGLAARTVFETVFAGGASYLGVRVPVENVGGAGSRDGHWRESVLRNELMTSLLNAGTNTLSALSLVSMRDMGYLVNDAVAEPFAILPSLQGAPGGGGRSIEMPPVAPEVPRRMPRRR